MRVTTVFRRLLGVTDISVSGVSLDEMGATVRVEPRKRRPRCGECAGKAPGYDRAPTRRWRHVGIGAVRIWLEYAPRRVQCGRCQGVRVERVPWAAAGSLFTLAFEETVAYLAQGTDQTKVTRLMGIAWQTVGAIVERVVKRGLDPSRMKSLRLIGVDEFGYRKRHRYITLVVDHEKTRVVWAKEGRSAETLKGFFDELGPEERAKVSTVTMDLSGGYTKAVTEAVPQATISYDRFHVQRLASAAVDEVRRQEVRDAPPDEADPIKKTRFALLRNPWNLTKKDTEKLSIVQETNQRLYRAYLLKESLRDALDCGQPMRAMGKLREWMAWASHSKLRPFVRAARTVRKHLGGIAAYLTSRLTNGLTEGINNKIRVIARRAYGFHSASALIGMVFLNCGGLQLSPPLPRPTPV